MRDPVPAQIHHAEIVMAHALHWNLIFKHEDMTNRSLDPCIDAVILHHAFPFPPSISNKLTMSMENSLSQPCRSPWEKHFLVILWSTNLSPDKLHMDS